MVTQLPSSTANKDYHRAPFILTDIKLTRLVEVARERIGRVQGEGQLVESFAVVLKSSREIVATSLEQVLSLDNSIQNPIVELAYRVSVRDTKHLILFRFNASDGSTIRLHVSSDNFVWVKETEGAIEEQADRAVQTTFVYKFGSSWFEFSSIVVAIVAALTAAGSLLSKGPGKLSADQAAEFARSASAANTDSEKLDYLFKLSRALHSPADSNVFDYLANARTYFVGVPILVTLLAVVAALGWHYPRAVFEWGDWKHHHERIVERRKFLWYGVIAAMLLGLLGNVFWLGLVPPR